jgi:hypothetical protein
VIVKDGRTGRLLIDAFEIEHLSSIIVAVKCGEVSSQVRLRFLRLRKSTCDADDPDTTGCECLRCAVHFIALDSAVKAAKDQLTLLEATETRDEFTNRYNLNPDLLTRAKWSYATSTFIMKQQVAEAQETVQYFGDINRAIGPPCNPEGNLPFAFTTLEEYCENWRRSPIRARSVHRTAQGAAFGAPHWCCVFILPCDGQHEFYQPSRYEELSRTPKCLEAMERNQDPKIRRKQLGPQYSSVSEHLDKSISSAVSLQGNGKSASTADLSRTGVRREKKTIL